MGVSESRPDERGMITLWVLGLTVAVMFLGGIGVDFWRAIAVRREVSMMADAAATAGANGLDESVLRGGELQLDEGRARALVAAELAENPDTSWLTGEDVTVNGAQVTVTLREPVNFPFLGSSCTAGSSSCRPPRPRSRKRFRSALATAHTAAPGCDLRTPRPRRSPCPVCVRCRVRKRRRL